MVKSAYNVRLTMIFITFVTVTLSTCLGGMIKKYTFNNNGLGTYSFEYETVDGTYRREEGGLVAAPDSNSLVVRGEYGYIDTNGRPYFIKYVADANGFHPSMSSDHTRFNDRRII